MTDSKGSEKTLEMGYANLDLDRKARTGRPETVYCEGKTSLQVAEIMKRLTEAQPGENIFGTRASAEDYAETLRLVPDVRYDEMSRILYVKHSDETSGCTVAVASAGTADMSVAEEASLTLELFGHKVTRIYDVGVAGIHRLMGHESELCEADVVIVVAGMEGALASVVGGMVAAPVIGVPTSVGYGANFSGLAALLSMLNSCANGVGVVNIDNGFGAACLADKILKAGR